MRRARSLPASLDTYEQVVRLPFKAPFERVLATLFEIVAQAQRPLSAEDYERARKDPVCGDKAADDLFYLGCETQMRRARRHERAGRSGRARACRAAGIAAAGANVLTGSLAGFVLMVGRLVEQKQTGVTFHNARTEGGVREDVILDVLHHFNQRLGGPLDWALADRDPHVPLHAQISVVLSAAAQTEADLQSYVAGHPDPRVRDSEALRAAFRQVHLCLSAFYADLIATAAGTMQLPPPSEGRALARPPHKSRAWYQAETGFLRTP